MSLQIKLTNRIILINNNICEFLSKICLHLKYLYENYFNHLLFIINYF